MPDYCSTAQAKDKEIQNLISNKSCSNDADCRNKAYGHKSCGGPSSYLIYSSKNVSEEILDSEVKEFYRLGEACAKSTKDVSTCDVILPPNVGCVQTVCVQIP
jgi:hypothetical protein